MIQQLEKCVSGSEQVTNTQHVRVGGDMIAAFPFITTKCGFLFS